MLASKPEPYHWFSLDPELINQVRCQLDIPAGKFNVYPLYTVSTLWLQLKEFKHLEKRWYRLLTVLVSMTVENHLLFSIYLSFCLQIVIRSIKTFYPSGFRDLSLSLLHRQDSLAVQYHMISSIYLSFYLQIVYQSIKTFYPTGPRLLCIITSQAR